MPAIVRFLTDSLPLLCFLSYHATTHSLLLTMRSGWQITTYKCRHTCRHKHGFQQIQERWESASPNNEKTIPWSGTDKFGARPAEACLPCSHYYPKRWLQSPQMAIPRSFQPPAPTLLCPWGPLTNHTPSLSLPGKFKQLRRGTIPVPHPTLWSYFHHTYIQMGRQICFCQLWLPDWQPEAAMWADAHTLWSLSFRIRTSCVKSAHFLFYLALKSSQIGQFHTSCMFQNYHLNCLHWKIKTIFCT